MRNRIYLEKTSGSTVVIREHTTKDLLPLLYILNNTSKEALALYKNPEQVGRKYRKVAEIVGARIFRHFMHIVVNRLMESDRLVLDNGLSLLIAHTKNNPKRIVKYRKKKQIYWGSLGTNCGVVLHGMKHRYYFRMPQRRRIELRDRIRKGQNFAKL